MIALEAAIPKVFPTAGSRPYGQAAPCRRRSRTRGSQVACGHRHLHGALPAGHTGPCHEAPVVKMGYLPKKRLTRAKNLCNPTKTDNTEKEPQTLTGGWYILSIRGLGPQYYPIRREPCRSVNVDHSLRKSLPASLAMPPQAHCRWLNWKMSWGSFPVLSVWCYCTTRYSLFRHHDPSSARKGHWVGSAAVLLSAGLRPFASASAFGFLSLSFQRTRKIRWLCQDGLGA